MQYSSCGFLHTVSHNLGLVSERVQMDNYVPAFSAQIIEQLLKRGAALSVTRQMLSAEARHCTEIPEWFATSLTGNLAEFGVRCGG